MENIRVVVKYSQKCLQRPQNSGRHVAAPCVYLFLGSIRQTVKIGRPGYQVTKSRDPVKGQRTLHFTIHYPEIEEGLQPRHRFMSAYEQKKEVCMIRWEA